MENIIKYILKLRTLENDLDHLHSHRLSENNKYKKVIDDLYEAIILKCNKKEFTFSTEDRYEQGNVNGIEINEGTLENKYRELGRVGYVENFLTERNREVRLQFSYRRGYCSPIKDIFTIKINNNLIYLSNGTEEQFVIDNKHKIFEIVSEIDKECKNRFEFIDSIIGKYFIYFERKVYDEENTICEIERDKHIKKYTEDSLNEYLNT